MSNPASFLSDFFNLNAKEQHRREIRPLLEAVTEIEDRLETLKATGFRTAPFEDLGSIVRVEIKSSSDSTLSFILTNTAPGSYNSIRLRSAEHHLLDVLSERLELRDVTSGDTVSAIRGLLAQAKQLVTDDKTLDIELRLFISRTILAIEKQLDDVEILGEFQLQNALVTLFGLLRTAEANSTEPAKWSSMWEKWGVPIAQGVISGLPQTALGIGTIFAALPPGS